MGNTLGEQASLVLLGVPVHEVHFMKELFHGTVVILKVRAVDKSRIPFDQDVPKVEYDGFDGYRHPAILH
jgi:hypothetical protein